MIGIAAGTGNIWRFPRIAAKYNGGSFLLPWVIFLLIWSIPIIIIEYAMGKGTRKGTIGAFGLLMGKRFCWLGAFVGFVSTAILFYYSVVSGWCLKYLVLSLTTGFQGLSHERSLEMWNRFMNSYQPILFHFLAMLVGGYIVYRGVVGGIEKANFVFVPGLIILLFVLFVRSVTLPGASGGIRAFFTLRSDILLDYRVWLDALAQNAWSTGAGWGLFLTYAVYMRQREDITLNSGITGFGDHAISLLAGITIFSTVYALVPDAAEAVITEPGPMNTGLAFIWIPRLFATLPAGNVFSAFFFIALFFAALASLISMIELVVRVLNDAGVRRSQAIFLVCAAGFLLGIPSALSPSFFLNQDWAWGVGLILSGAFFAIAVIRYGPQRFRQDYVNVEGTDLRVGRPYDWVVKFLIPLQVIVLISWWFWMAIQADPQDWWNPFRVETVGTCFFQWGVVILVFLALNRWIADKTIGR
ncbi:MAG: sodium-dependent transporter [Acidobacteria bacterium]|nr:sodium-dependent transporter [Acidobacteriota bacterium]